jgi:hypothetical protein
VKVAYAASIAAVWFANRPTSTSRAAFEAAATGEPDGFGTATQ